MRELTHLSFRAFVESNRFAVVHFRANWNGYDVQMRERLREVPAELSRQVAFGALDVDPPEHHQLCREHGVLNIPFLAFYRGGQLSHTLTGLREQGEIEESVKRLVSGPATM